MKAEQEVTMTIGRDASAAGNTAVQTFGRNNQMNCAEFQRDLPLIIDSGGSEHQEEHLRTCDVCRGLVNDLRYIADQAKLLIPMLEPSPKVWDGIEEKLKLEGLVKPVQARRSYS
jgi:TATA-binding protein-associated factor Taf7